MAINPPLTLPFIFTNGTVIDATQMNADLATIVGALNSNSQTLLTASTNFYVSPVGIDAPGNGLSPASPAATHNFIRQFILVNYALNGGGVVVNFANGTYNQSMVVDGVLTGQTVPSQYLLQGNMSNPSLVTFDGDPSLFFSNGAGAVFQGMTLQSSTSSSVVSQNSSVAQFQTCVFGNAIDTHLTAARGGSLVAIGNYSIGGGGMSHCRGVQGAGRVFLVEQPADYAPPALGVPVITFVGTPAFTVAFCQARNLGLVEVAATFVGSATGPRFSLHNNGVINIFGQSTTTYLPGSSAGINDGTGGQIN